MAYWVVSEYLTTRRLVNPSHVLKRKKVSAMCCTKCLKAPQGNTVGGERPICNLTNTPNYSRVQNSKEMVDMMALIVLIRDFTIMKHWEDKDGTKNHHWLSCGPPYSPTVRDPCGLILPRGDNLVNCVILSSRNIYPITLSAGLWWLIECYQGFWWWAAGPYPWLCFIQILCQWLKGKTG